MNDFNNSWKTNTKEYNLNKILSTVKRKLQSLSEEGNLIFPNKKDIFKAFKLCSFDEVKVVILGQDPYHRINQANGLAFSVNKKIKIPPSLLNIFKEYSSDLNLKIPKSGNLNEWSQQGVFLLNSILTVEEGKPGSHKDLGWMQFTDKIIEILSEKKINIVFILWGAYAQSKIKLIDAKKHLIITSPHPSPLSAHKGFFGSKPFSKCNKYLKNNKITEINWTIS